MKCVDYIFLLSSDRSGSNLVLRMLGTHPELTAPPTSQLMPNLYKAEAIYDDLGVDGNWNSLLRNSANLHKAGFGQWTQYANLDCLRHQAGSRSVSLILKTIFEAEVKARQTRKIVIKAHRAYEYADRVLSDFPEAKFIHLVRDPRDMALSWWKTPGLRGGIVRASRLWQTEQARLLELSERLGKKCHSLKYEDVLSDTRHKLAKLCRFLDIPFNSDMLTFHESRQTRDIAGHIEAWSNLAKPLMSRNQKKYRQALTEKQCAFVEMVCAKEMSVFGYVCDIEPDAFDMDQLEQELLAEEPWEKPEYALISEAEKRSHKELRVAVNQLLSGS